MFRSLHGHAATLGVTASEVSTTTDDPILAAASPAERLAVDASGTLIARNARGQPVAAAGVWIVPATHASRALLTCDGPEFLGHTDASGRLNATLTAGAVEVVASRAGLRAASSTMRTGGEVVVTLADGADLDIECVDLEGSAVSGVRVALDFSAVVSDDTLMADQASTPAYPRLDEMQFSGVSDANGMVSFRGTPAGTPFWRFHAAEHGLVDGPGFRDGPSMTSPGRHRFVFAPLVVAGLAVTGDELVEFRWAGMRSDLIPSDRSGAGGRAEQRFRKRFPSMNKFLLFPVRTRVGLPPLEATVLLARTGSRNVTLSWHSVAEFENVGPTSLSIESDPSARAIHVGTITIRVANPDGTHLSDCPILLQSPTSSAAAMSGRAMRMASGRYRILGGQPSVTASIDRGESVAVEGGTEREHTIVLRRNLRPVRVHRPAAAKGQGLCYVEFRSAVGGRMNLRLDSSDDALAFLPEGDITADATWGTSSSTPIQFTVRQQEAECSVFLGPRD